MNQLVEQREAGVGGALQMGAFRLLVEAALDQRKPSKKLVKALNRALTAIQHPHALKPVREREAA